MIGSIGSPNYVYNTQSVTAAAAPETQSVDFSYNSQDQLVMSAGTAKVDDVSTKGSHVSTSRVKLNDSLKPNEDGSYVFDQKARC